jgi:hypothetical protein
MRCFGMISIKQKAENMEGFGFLFHKIALGDRLIAGTITFFVLFCYMYNKLTVVFIPS